MTIETPAGRRSSSAAPLAPPGGQPEPITGVTDSQLAVLLRQTQWALDEAAHDFPAGRVTPTRREELAVTLESLAAIVRASTPYLVR
ncbi:MAG: hypothetical protein ACRDTE_13350 [Pseudonocardiaceae bacterium]